MIKNKLWGIYWLPAQRGRGGGRLQAVSHFSWSFEQNARDTQMTTRVVEGARRERPSFLTSCGESRSTLARACTPLGRSLGWGKRKIDNLFFFLAHADVFQTNEKKNKSTSVYRLVSKVSGFEYDPKNPPPLWIVFGLKIPISILVKKHTLILFQFTF